MSFKKPAAFLLSMLIFATNLNSVSASKIDGLKQKQNAINKEVADAKQKLQESKNKKDITLNEISNYDIVLNDITRELERIESELIITEDKLVVVSEELVEAEEKRDYQYEVFKERARYMYINGKMSYIDIIFKADNFSDMLKRFDYVNRIVQYDSEMVEKLQEAEELVALKVEETQKQKNDLEVLKYSRTESLEEYESLRADKKVQLEQLELNIEQYNVVMAELEKSSDEIEKSIKQHMAEQERLAASQQVIVTYDVNAQLLWPVPGRTATSSGYVNRVNPVNGKREFHSGIDIPAPYGTNIVAAEGGTVVTAGWVNGYGNTIIIDHGGGLQTLYGHNSSLVAKKGDRVVRGQVVAKCGSTGMSTGNHCHFEVRRNGSHVNPNPYLGR